VQVTAEMQVDLLHRKHLRVATAGSPSLDAEDRSHRGFPNHAAGIVPARVEALIEADGGQGLALSEGSRADAGDQNEMPPVPVLLGLDGLPVDLGDVRPVENQVTASQSELFGHRLYGAHRGTPGDIEVAVHHSRRGRASLETFIDENPQGSL